jgi:TatD DNase family protein
MELIDSHAHLDFPQYDADRSEMLERAREAGVRAILAIGIGDGPDHLRAAIPFAEEHDWVFATAGIHPHEARLAQEGHFADLEEASRHPRVLAVGEIGLDYFYDHSPQEVQKRVFRRQMEIAGDAGLPIVIHCRDAWSDCLEILDQDWADTGLGGIFHCFTGTEAEARRGIAMNFLISFAGNLTYSKNSELRKVAAALPLDQVLIETDSPFLAPQGRRGKRNEPAFVAEVARTLANVRDLSVDEAAAVTSGNFRRFFPRTASATGEGIP